MASVSRARNLSSGRFVVWDVDEVIRAVERAAQLDPTFRDLGTRVTVSQAMDVLEAHGELVGLLPLEKVRDVEVNILVEPQS